LKTDYCSYYYYYCSYY